MKSLDELKNQRPQILLAELAGLLHNIGKLNSKFISKYSAGSSADYEFDIVLPPSDFLPQLQCHTLIRTNRGEALARLLCNENIWGAATSTAAQFGANLTGNSTAVRGTRRRIKQVAKQLPTGTPSSPYIAEVRDKLASAIKLAELCQNTAPAACDDLDHLRKDRKQQAFLKDTRLDLLGVRAALGELITLMWEQYHGFSNGQLLGPALEFWTQRDSRLQRYLIIAHGAISEIEKKLPDNVQDEPQTSPPFAATAFGYESKRKRIRVGKIDRRRDTWLNQVIQQTPLCLSQPIEKPCIQQRETLIDVTCTYLLRGLGETRRPLNDVTLWDYVSTISTLFKAAIAKTVIEGQFAETESLQWRLLSIRYDGLEYLSRAHHISDLLARRDTIEAALDAIKAVIEVEYPMGNEIYRDENGSVLLVPDVRDGKQRIELLAQECGTAGTLDDLLLKRFSEASYGEEKDDRSPLGGEIRPIVALSDERLGKQINLTEAKGWSHPPLQADPEEVQSWWSDPKKCDEVCTVCGLRPQGFGAPDGRHPKTGKKGWKLHLEENHHEHKNRQPLECEVCKAIDRQVCWVCMERRDDRSKKWMNNTDGSLKRTIWTDEVADSNGRLALVVGRFVLDGWLDGTLIPTMQKSASFARIQRCWRTTQEFWQEVEKKLPELVGEDSGSRLKLTPENQLKDKLGPSHAYDLELNGRYLSVVWTGDHFITADNLEYFGQTAGLGKDPDWKALLEEKSFCVCESSARLGHRNNKAQVTIKEGGVAHGERYSPFIPILAQPALFIALVPANKAMEVARRIKCKYETEMGRVRDRLPLHLGLVIAPRRTPVRVLLEAGRRMLEIPDVWEEWEVESVSHNTQHHITFKNNGVKWHIPAVMGDGATPDHWYPHLMLRKPVEGEDLTTATPSPWTRARDLHPGDRVYVRPSRFDFEFLDTTGRRFELNYDEAGVRVAPANRLHHSTRPLLLEEIADLEIVWKALKKLPGGQRDFLARLIETKRTEWKVTTADDPVLRRFACDTLKQTGAEQKWWTDKLDDEQRRLLEEWATNGRLADAVELYEKMMKLET